jgi:hypothetical protein
MSIGHLETALAWLVVRLAGGFFRFWAWIFLYGMRLRANPAGDLHRHRLQYHLRNQLVQADHGRGFNANLDPTGCLTSRCFVSG